MDTSHSNLLYTLCTFTGFKMHLLSVLKFKIDLVRYIYGFSLYNYVYPYILYSNSL